MKVIPQSAALYRAAVRDLNSTLHDPMERAEARARIAELVLFKRVANPGQSWTYASLGQILGLSASQVHRSVQRATEAGLAVSKGRRDWEVIPAALTEFAVHGVRYAFPAKMGANRRGIPTSFGASPLSAQINAAPGEAPV